MYILGHFWKLDLFFVTYNFCSDISWISLEFLTTKNDTFICLFKAMTSTRFYCHNFSCNGSFLLKFWSHVADNIVSPIIHSKNFSLFISLNKSRSHRSQKIDVFPKSHWFRKFKLKPFFLNSLKSKQNDITCLISTSGPAHFAKVVGSELLHVIA